MISVECKTRTKKKQKNEQVVSRDARASINDFF